MGRSYFEEETAAALPQPSAGGGLIDRRALFMRGLNLAGATVTGGLAGISQGDSIHRMMFGREQDSDCLNE